MFFVSVWNVSVVLTDMHKDCWIKRDQLDVTCFIMSLFTAQHVSDVNTSILRSLWLIWRVISWVVLFWFDVCWCYGVVWLGWCGIRMQTEACIRIPYHIKLVYLYSTNKMMHGPINININIKCVLCLNLSSTFSANQANNIEYIACHVFFLSFFLS